MDGWRFWQVFTVGASIIFLGTAPLSSCSEESLGPVGYTTFELRFGLIGL